MSFRRVLKFKVSREGYRRAHHGAHLLPLTPSSFPASRWPSCCWSQTATPLPAGLFWIHDFLNIHLTLWTKKIITVPLLKSLQHLCILFFNV
jgi:hypothetical protein